MLRTFEEGGWGMGTVPWSQVSTWSIVNQTLNFLSGPIVQSIVTEKKKRIWRRL